MREVQIIVHCDVCQSVLFSKSVPPLDLGDGYRELDLCETHIAELWTPLHDVYFDAPKSQSAAPPTKRSEPRRGRKRRGVDGVGCTVSGCTHVFRNREDARRHMISVHHTTIGLEQARLGHGLNGDPITHRCDECEEAYVTGQELGQHNVAVHGLKK